MKIRWYKSNNWGDALNPILVEYISGKKPTWVDFPNWKNFFKFLPSQDIYLVIGSILAKGVDKNTIVWGTGFISITDKIRTKPKKVCAVRGPLTRELLLRQDIYCPEIYGDPALLLPRFYKPNVKKINKLGIIPHYVDTDNVVLDKFRKDRRILIIDIRKGIKEVVNDVCSCETIASSSLHGIILADAYGIPSLRLKFSNRIVGGNFKFMDYYMSVKKINFTPLIMNKSITFQDMLQSFEDYRIRINLDRLMDSCPFKSRNL